MTGQNMINSMINDMINSPKQRIYGTPLWTLLFGIVFVLLPNVGFAHDMTDTARERMA